MSKQKRNCKNQKYPEETKAGPAITKHLGGVIANTGPVSLQGKVNCSEDLKH